MGPREKLTNITRELAPLRPASRSRVLTTGCSSVNALHFDLPDRACHAECENLGVSPHENGAIGSVAQPPWRRCAAGAQQRSESPQLQARSACPVGRGSPRSEPRSRPEFGDLFLPSVARTDVALTPHPRSAPVAAAGRHRRGFPRDFRFKPLSLLAVAASGHDRCLRDEPSPATFTLRLAEFHCRASQRPHRCSCRVPRRLDRAGGTSRRRARPVGSHSRGRDAAKRLGPHGRWLATSRRARRRPACRGAHPPGPDRGVPIRVLTAGADRLPGPSQAGLPKQWHAGFSSGG
jgi:hypothetical protein